MMKYQIYCICIFSQLFYLTNSSPSAVLDKIRLGGFFPMKTTVHGISNSIASQYLAAFMMAIREINDKSDGISDELLPRTHIHFSIKFPRGQFLKGISTALSLAEDSFDNTGVHACVGPGTDSVSKSTSQILTQFRIPQIAYYSMSSQLGAKDEYPYFMRTSDSESNDGIVISGLISDYFKWKRITVFYTTDPYGSNNFLELSNMASKTNSFQIISSHAVRVGSNNQWEHIIASAKTMRTTIFVFFMDETNAALLLQEGYDAGIFGTGTQIIGGSKLCNPTLWKSLSNQQNIADIMKGFLCLSIAFNTTSQLNQDFVKRWRAQPKTVDIHPDGTKTCNSTRDDDNSWYLYKDYPDDNMSLPLQCTGLDFSLFAENGSDIDPYVRHTYDATFALAYGFHNLLYIQNKAYINGDDLLNTLINNISFTGLTGLLEFSKGLGGYNNYGRGDRSTGLLYNILNFQQISYQVSSESSGLVDVGQWSSEYGFVSTSSTAKSSIIYNTDDNSIPADTIAEVVILMSNDMKLMIITTASLCFALVIVLTLFVIKYRKTGIMKASHVTILFIILFGGAIGAGRILNASYDVTDSTCLAGTFLGHMTFILIFNSLLVKTWRVHKLVNSKMKKKKISSKRVLAVTLLGASLVLLYLVVMAGVSKPSVIYYRVTTSTDTLVYNKCGQSYPIFTSLLFIYEGLCLLMGARLCWATRNVPDAINESKYIAIGTYVIFFICLVLFPLTHLVSLDATTEQLVVALGFGVSILSCLSIVFIPKLHMLLSGKDVDAHLRIVERTRVAKVFPLSQSRMEDARSRLSSWKTSGRHRSSKGGVSSSNGSESSSRIIDDLTVLTDYWRSCILQIYDSIFMQVEKDPRNDDQKKSQNLPVPSFARQGSAVLSISRSISKTVRNSPLNSGKYTMKNNNIKNTGWESNNMVENFVNDHQEVERKSPEEKPHVLENDIKSESINNEI